MHVPTNPTCSYSDDVGKAFCPMELVLQNYHNYLIEADTAQDEKDAIKLNMPPNFDESRFPQGHLQLQYNRTPLVHFNRTPFKNNKGAFKDKVHSHHIWFKGAWTIESMCYAISKGELYFCPLSMLKISDPKAAKERNPSDDDKQDDPDYKPSGSAAAKNKDDDNLELSEQQADKTVVVPEPDEDNVAKTPIKQTIPQGRTRSATKRNQAATPASQTTETPRKRRKFMKVGEVIDIDKANESDVRAMLKLLLEHQPVIDLTEDDTDETTNKTLGLFTSLGVSMETVEIDDEEEIEDSKQAAK